LENEDKNLKKKRKGHAIVVDGDIRCPVCENLFEHEGTPQFCPRCAWDLENDPSLTLTIGEIPEVVWKAYQDKLSLARNIWNGQQRLETEKQGLESEVKRHRSTFIETKKAQEEKDEALKEKDREIQSVRKQMDELKLKVRREIKEAKGGPAANLNSREGSFQNPRKQSAIHNPDICNTAAESTSGKNRDREGIDNYKVAHKYKTLSLITCLAVMTIPTTVEFFDFQRPLSIMNYPSITFSFLFSLVYFYSFLIGIVFVNFALLPYRFNETKIGLISNGLWFVIFVELSLNYKIYSKIIPLYDSILFCSLNSISSILAYIMYSLISSRRFSIIYILLVIPGIFTLSVVIFALRDAFIHLLKSYDLDNLYLAIICSFCLSIIFQIIIVLSLASYFNGLVKGRKAPDWNVD